MIPFKLPERESRVVEKVFHESGEGVTGHAALLSLLDRLGYRASLREVRAACKEGGTDWTPGHFLQRTDLEAIIVNLRAAAEKRNRGFDASVKEAYRALVEAGTGNESHRGGEEPEEEEEEEEEEVEEEEEEEEEEDEEEPETEEHANKKKEQRLRASVLQKAMADFALHLNVGSLAKRPEDRTGCAPHNIRLKDFTAFFEGNGRLAEMLGKGDEGSPSPALQSQRDLPVQQQPSQKQPLQQQQQQQVPDEINRAGELGRSSMKLSGGIFASFLPLQPESKRLLAPLPQQQQQHEQQQQQQPPPPAVQPASSGYKDQRNGRHLFNSSWPQRWPSFEVGSTSFESSLSRGGGPRRSSLLHGDGDKGRGAEEPPCTGATPSPPPEAPTKAEEEGAPPDNAPRNGNEDAQLRERRRKRKEAQRALVEGMRYRMQLHQLMQRRPVMWESSEDASQQSSRVLWELSEEEEFQHVLRSNDSGVLADASDSSWGSDADPVKKVMILPPADFTPRDSCSSSSSSNGGTGDGEAQLEALLHHPLRQKVIAAADAPLSPPPPPPAAPAARGRPPPAPASRARHEVTEGVSNVLRTQSLRERTEQLMQRCLVRCRPANAWLCRELSCSLSPDSPALRTLNSTPPASGASITRRLTRVLPRGQSWETTICNPNTFNNTRRPIHNPLRWNKLSRSRTKKRRPILARTQPAPPLQERQEQTLSQTAPAAVGQPVDEEEEEEEETPEWNEIDPSAQDELRRQLAVTVGGKTRQWATPPWRYAP